VSATHQKILNQYVDRIIGIIKEYAQDHHVSDIVTEASDSLQELRIRDLENLQLSLTKKEVQLSREKELDSNTLQKFDISYQIIEKAIEKRRENHFKPSYPMEQNLLDSGPWFGGKKKLNKTEDSPKEERQIVLVKNGPKTLTYKNERGQLLSFFDTKVLLGLMKLWDRNGKQSVFQFHDYELLNILNLSKGGSMYNAIEESLTTLFATSVAIHEFDFYENGAKKSSDYKEFHLINSRGKQDKFRKEDGQIRSTTYEIEFSKYIQNSLIAGYFRYISLSVLDDLQNETAQGLYLMMNSMQLHKDGYFEATVDQIIEYVGLEKEQRPARLKQRIEKACDQLLDTRIIKDRKFFIDDKKTIHLRIYPTEWFIEILTSTNPKELPTENLITI
jgi:hypothetical protein